MLRTTAAGSDFKSAMMASGSFSRAQSKGAGCHQSALKIGSGGSRSQHPGRVRRQSHPRSDQRGAGGRFVHRSRMEAVVDEREEGDEEQWLLFSPGKEIGADRIAG